MDIKQTLQYSTEFLKSHNIPSATLDAEVLLLEVLNKVENRSCLSKKQSSKCKESHHNRDICSSCIKPELQKDRSWLYTHTDFVLSKNGIKMLNNFLNQRIKHKPVAYITNRKEFFGYEFFVNENVLIPRPETELIVEEVLKIIKKEKCQINNYNLIDVGTGSGCILISILNELKKTDNLKLINQSTGIDISQEAINIAKNNSIRHDHEDNIKFMRNDFRKIINEDLFTNSGDFIITANLPYIAKKDYDNLDFNVKNFEPKTALISGEDGLDDIKAILSNLSNIKLKKGQIISLLLEAEPQQMPIIVHKIQQTLQYSNIKKIKDLSGKERVISINLISNAN